MLVKPAHSHRRYVWQFILAQIRESTNKVFKLYGLQINAIALININSAVKYFVNILVIDATDTPRPESAHFARSEFPAQLIMYKMRFILNCLIRIMPLTTTT
jgi:hypothetical protein